MRLVIAKTAGFCMGVDMALRKLDSLVTNPPPGGQILTLGPIIHNPQVLELYKSQGVIQADQYTCFSSADVVIIRAHGIPRDIQQAIEAQGATIIDATCPKVKKAQILISRQAEMGKHLLLFGERDHPEVRGLMSYAREHTVFENLAELIDCRLSATHNYFLAAQTTQDQDSFEHIERYMRDHISPDLTVLDTICTATKDRQDEVRSLARQVQAIIVVGGKNSGNTRRLAQIAQESGIFTTHIEVASELPLASLKNFKHIGLTAGASTPSWIIQEVADTLDGHFRCLSDC